MADNDFVAIPHNQYNLLKEIVINTCKEIDATRQGHDITEFLETSASFEFWALVQEFDSLEDFAQSRHMTLEDIEHFIKEWELDR